MVLYHQVYPLVSYRNCHIAPNIHTPICNASKAVFIVLSIILRYLNTCNHMEIVPLSLFILGTYFRVFPISTLSVISEIFFIS